MQPLTPIEEGVAGVFSSVLELDSVRGEDSFFELGGKSLAALEVLARLQATYGVAITPTAFFETPTVQGVARLILVGTLRATGQEDIERLLTEAEKLT